MKRLLVFSLLISGALMFFQNDYTLKFGRTDVVRVNESILTNVNLITTKYNRTQPVINSSFTCVIDLENNIQIIIQAYTFLSNEYRMFPIRYEFNFCDAFAKNEYGLKTMLLQGNFTGCPVKKGRYAFRNWIPDGSRFPPFIPNGDYMLEIEGFYLSSEIGVMRGYGTVSRPLGRRH